MCLWGLSMTPLSFEGNNKVLQAAMCTGRGLLLLLLGQEPEVQQGTINQDIVKFLD